MEKQTCICNHCGETKEGIQTGLCNHCSRFGFSNEYLAMGWWHDLSDHKRDNLILKYNMSKHVRVKRIIEVWEQEIQEESTKFEYEIMDDGSNYPENGGWNNLSDDQIKTIHKPTKQGNIIKLNPELAKTYINQFNDEDKIKLLELLLDQIKPVFYINGVCVDGGKYSEFELNYIKLASTNITTYDGDNVLSAKVGQVDGCFLKYI